MLRAARFNAKAPEQAFAPDSTDKRHAAAVALHALAEQHFSEVMQRLRDC